MTNWRAKGHAFSCIGDTERVCCQHCGYRTTRVHISIMTDCEKYGELPQCDSRFVFDCNIGKLSQPDWRPELTSA